MAKSIESLVNRFYEIVNGDDGEFSEIFSEDFVFGIMPGFAYGGDHIGLEATNNFFDKLGAHFEFWEVHTDKFIPINEENYVVTGTYKSKCIKTNKDFEMQTVHLWTAKNGMLTSYKHYCDTAILSNAMNHEVPQ